MGRPLPAVNEMRLGVVTDGMCHHAAVRRRRFPAGLSRPPSTPRRIPRPCCDKSAAPLSLDHDAAPWAEVGARYPVIGALQREFAGLRPVLFHSPYEAAAWSIISAGGTARRRR